MHIYIYIVICLYGYIVIHEYIYLCFLEHCPRNDICLPRVYPQMRGDCTCAASNLTGQVFFNPVYYFTPVAS